MLLAIDPDNMESAYVVVDDNLKPGKFGKIENAVLLEKMQEGYFVDCSKTAIEMVASYGMSVGREVFETCVWIGRFTQTVLDRLGNVHVIYRMDVKTHICHDSRIKDSNIRQALIDRLGVVGVKKSTGWFYGFAGDVWSAYAVAVTTQHLKEKRPSA